uniref:Small transmembrane regulator of ion transport 1 n=1 Tax=Sciurus vulgaris TaxID=55149 RepID=A0A8D2CNG4_SCIVU
MAGKAESTLQHFLVPILLLIGWIVGCVIVIYVVFS